MSTWAILLLVAFTANVNSTKQKPFQFKHHNNDEMYETMLDVHEKCPNITSIYRLSENSVEGRPLLVLVFSIHPTSHKACKQIVSIHK